MYQEVEKVKQQKKAVTKKLLEKKQKLQGKKKK